MILDIVASAHNSVVVPIPRLDLGLEVVKRVVVASTVAADGQDKGQEPKACGCRFVLLLRRLLRADHSLY